MAKESVFFVEKPGDSLGFLLWKNTTIWQRNIKAALASFDISHAQFVIMAAARWFYESKQEPTQVAIANMTGLDKMTISKSLKKLSSLGIVSRSEDVRDTRAKIVVLTTKGNNLIVKLVSLVEGVDRQFFGVLLDKEQKLLNQVFCKLEEKNANNDN
jgi:DNA-binding MarR family transcriptional regulator